MNVLAPVLRPAFGWNHAVVMRWGGEGLGRLLGARFEDRTGADGVTWASDTGTPRSATPARRRAPSRACDRVKGRSLSRPRNVGVRLVATARVGPAPHRGKYRPRGFEKAPFQRMRVRRRRPDARRNPAREALVLESSPRAVVVESLASHDSWYGAVLYASADENAP